MYFVIKRSQFPYFLKKKYFYYKINKNYYRIPLYNKLIKIIDWGRATYNFNGIKTTNYIFREDGDAYGQYIFSNINNNKKIVNSNPSIDLAILGTSILKIYKIKDDLYDMINNWITDIEGKKLNLELTFNMYKQAAHKCKNAIPKNQFTNKIFDIFKIDKKSIENEHIYKL